VIGAEWIRTSIPQAWQVARLRDHATVVNGYPFDSELFSAESGLPLVRIRDIASEGTEVRYAGDVVPEALLRGGEILVGMDGDFNVARWKGGEALLNQRVCSVRPAATVDSRFLYYVLPAPLGLINEFTYSTTVKHLSSFDVLKIRFPFPPLSQQRAIADYLDRETARLDALVAAKQRVLGLLAEKRRALITRAVTRGLDPRAPLRDSGIPWLGEIPAHWETSKFTWSVFIVEGQVDPEVEPYCDMSLIAPNHVESGTGRLLGQETAGDQGAISGKYHCLHGDVIYSKIRPALRKATIAIEECLCSADMYPLRARDGIRPEFLLLYLLSEPFSTWAVLESNRVAMPKINREALSEIRIPVPSPAEQSLIVAHVQDATARIDSIRSATEGTLALLKERRAALIAAAVTGQIDVGQHAKQQGASHASAALS